MSDDKQLIEERYPPKKPVKDGYQPKKRETESNKVPPPPSKK